MTKLSSDLAGYADAWAGRDKSQRNQAYLRGYSEGELHLREMKERATLWVHVRRPARYKFKGERSH